MKDRALVILTAVVVVVVVGGMFVLVPALESPQRKLDESVGKTAEKARRTVARFNAEADAAAALVDRAGLTADVTPEKIETIVDADHRPAQEALAKEQERLQELQRSSVARLRQLDATFAELDSDAEITPPSVPTFSDNPEGMKRDLAQGMQQRNKLIKENRDQMNAALSEASAALQEQEGGASGRDNPLANRLSGIALMQEASAAVREATLRRQEAVSRLYELQAAVQARSDAASRTGQVRASEVEAQIAAREQALAAAKAAHADVSAAVDRLQGEIDALQQRIDEQAAIGDELRVRMDALAERGLNYDDPQGAARFSAEYSDLARQYRAARRSEHMLRNGGLANARIDERGDLLTGGFVSATPGGTVESVPGLVDLQADMRVAQVDLEGAATQVRIAETQLTAAKEQLTSLQSGDADAEQRMKALADQITTDYAAYQQAAEAALAAEEQALRKYRDAASAFAAAQTAQNTIVQGVPSDLSSEAKDRSPYKFIEDDAWIGGEAKSESADAQLAAALVLHARVRRLALARKVLDEAAQSAALDGYDAAALTQQIEEARTQGMELAEKATRSLESVARDLKSHWTLAASVAAANYVMSLFDRPELANLAMQNYSEVVKGREDNPNVRPFRLRLEQLHNRGQFAGDAPEAAPAEGQGQ